MQFSLDLSPVHRQENVYDAEMIYTNSEEYSRDEYAAMEKEIQRTIYGKGFEIYAWNDSSGYNYWNNIMRESNYIQLTVEILDQTILDMEELNQKLNNRWNELNNKYGRN